MSNNTCFFTAQSFSRMVSKLLFIAHIILLFGCNGYSPIPDEVTSAPVPVRKLDSDNAKNESVAPQHTPSDANDGRRKTEDHPVHVETPNGPSVVNNGEQHNFSGNTATSPNVREGRSVKGKPIVIRYYGAKSTSGPLTLVIGGVHGDEKPAIKLIEQFVSELDADDSGVVAPCRVAVIPQANPDGIAMNTRTNSRGVDLNRNFNTKNWKPKQPNKKQRYNPGDSPGSEPETQFLMQVIRDLRPVRIIVPHSPLKLINFDGPAEDLAKEMSRYTGYRVAPNVGYPTPGSIGNYAGVELPIPIPIITLELPPTISRKEMDNSLRALYAAVNFDKRCQNNKAPDQ